MKSDLVMTWYVCVSKISDISVLRPPRREAKGHTGPMGVGGAARRLVRQQGSGQAQAGHFFPGEAEARADAGSRSRGYHVMVYLL